MVHSYYYSLVSWYNEDQPLDLLLPLSDQPERFG
jgi:hypothetical protein